MKSTEDDGLIMASKELLEMLNKQTVESSHDIDLKNSIIEIANKKYKSSILSIKVTELTLEVEAEVGIRDCLDIISIGLDKKMKLPDLLPGVRESIVTSIFMKNNSTIQLIAATVNS